MVLPIKSSTIDLAFIKFVQDGSQNNSQCCINECAWTSAKKIWIPMIKKMTPSWTESSLVMKHGSTITSQSVNGRLWNGNIHSHPSGKSSKAMLTVFWDSQGPILEHYQDRGSKTKQCSLQWDAYWQAEAWNSKQTSRTPVERHCVVACQCPSAYCCPHSWNVLETKVWGIGSPSV